MQRIGDRIKELRTYRGMTQKELAESVGVKEATLSRYENDQRIQSWEILSQIADVFDTSVDYLLCRTAEPAPFRSIMLNESIETRKIKFYQYYRQLNKYEREILVERALTLAEYSVSVQDET
ncbi:MAG: helix-turn-helix domain-containing protein [Clostridiales Family XIII bacterium]|jgi:transcriptional regulator with XRE-family HTH domain|nr:helix-turn-helix domain-containing protein [Clostridiales Family XIII bacterium]